MVWKSFGDFYVFKVFNFLIDIEFMIFVNVIVVVEVDFD